MPDWLQPFTEGLTDGEAGSSGSAGETMPKTPPPHVPARLSNKSGGKHHLFTHFVKDPGCDITSPKKSRESHAEEILKVEKIGYHEPHILGMFVQRIAKFSEKRTNRDYTIDMRS